MSDEEEQTGELKAVITVGADLLYAVIPDPAIDQQQHMILTIIGPEGVDLYVDGVPVDPETGRNPTNDALEAADEMVAWWAKSGWKLSTNTKQIQTIVDAYTKARQQLGVTEQAVSPISKQIPPPPPPRLVPKVEGKPGWNEFVFKMQKKYAKGQIIGCSCGEVIPTFEDLKIHWDQGHFENEDLSTPVGAVANRMPTREGPSTN